MQSIHVLGATAVVAATALLWSLSPPPTTPAPPPPPATAEGHYVLVVEGDRTALAITHASAKVDPWAGVPKGFTSDWRLEVHDAAGVLLAEVPLDVTPFATDAASLGQPVQVRGDVVRDSRIGMLVNVPRFATATSYAFSRPGERGARVALGLTAGAAVRELAGEAR